MTKEELILFLVSLWTEQEVEWFKDKDLDGNDYSFEQQIEERYEDYKPSYLSFEDIKKHQTEVVELFRGILNESNKSSIRNLFIDQLDHTVFISDNTQEVYDLTIENLKNQKLNKKKGVNWAIKEIVTRINQEIYESLKITIDQKTYSLEEQLKARWKDLWLWESKKVFKEYLDLEEVYGSLSCKKVKDLVTLQLFLFRIDEFFLIPPKNPFWIYYCFVILLSKKFQVLNNAIFKPYSVFVFSCLFVLGLSLIFVILFAI